MLIPLPLLFLAAVGATKMPAGSVVFAAAPYFEQHGHVYRCGGSHLYALNLKTRRLRQLTRGSAFDREPELSPDGRHILFWRGHGHGEYELMRSVLFTIGLSGSGLKSLKTAATSDLDKGLARAMLTAKRGLVRQSSGYDVSVVDSTGEELLTWPNVTFSPDGRYAMGPEGDDASARVCICDLRSGKLTYLDAGYVGALWLGADRIVANLRGKSQSFVILTPSGSLVDRGSVGVDENQEYPAEEEEIWYPHSSRRVYSLGPRSFLLEGLHFMSDGGFRYSYIIDLNRKTATPFGEESIEAVSQDRAWALLSRYEWVDGYKRYGSAKLCKLSLKRLADGTEWVVGPRLMTCEGACFVPSR